MKSGQIFKQFVAKDGTRVILRSIKWEDLQDCIEFANKLVAERDDDPDFGIILDKKQTLESESVWLANKLVEIEKGEQISVVAEVNGGLVGNSEISRGRTSDEFYHGKLGISLLREYRDQGMGFEMMKTLVDQSRNIGLKSIELEVFASNVRAIGLYEKVGFSKAGRIPKKIFRRGRFTDIIVMSIVL
jgi:RimJ/RimL family protein N-acetyltransferase